MFRPISVADSSTATGLKWATSSSGSTFAGCRLYKTNAQTFSNATFTGINWNSETIDTDGFHSTSSNTSRITIPSGKNGKYQLQCMFIFDSNATGSRAIRIVKNGTTVLNEIYRPPLTGSWTLSVTDVADLVATDYIEFVCYQNSGGNLDVNVADVYNFCSAFLIGA